MSLIYSADGRTLIGEQDIGDQIAQANTAIRAIAEKASTLEEQVRVLQAALAVFLHECDGMEARIEPEEIDAVLALRFNMRVTQTPKGSRIWLRLSPPTAAQTLADVDAPVGTSVDLPGGTRITKAA